jgi:hypothetical protein
MMRNPWIGSALGAYFGYVLSDVVIKKFFK